MKTYFSLDIPPYKLHNIIIKSLNIRTPRMNVKRMRAKRKSHIYIDWYMEIKGINYI